MSDKRLYEPTYLESLAYGILEAAPDYETGREALLEAYGQYEWTDKTKANEILSYYGQALKYRDKNIDPFEDVESLAPVRLEDVQKANPDIGFTDQYTAWEDLNKKYLTAENVPPAYAIIKEQLLNDISSYASAKRREANTSGMSDTQLLVQDTAAKFALGATAGFEPYINMAVETVTGKDYELATHLQEFTDPKRAAGYDETGEYSSGNIVGDLAQVTGNVAATVGGFVLNPVLGIGMLTTQAGDSVVTRYEDTKQKTGDTGLATKAAAIETGSQAIQLTADRLVFGRLLGRVTGKATGKVGKELIENVGAEAGSEAIGTAISNTAENIENQQDIGTDVLRGTGRSALLGAVGGGQATGFGLALEGVRKPKTPESRPAAANTSQRIDEVKVNGTPDTPVTVNSIGPIPTTASSIDPIIDADLDATMPVEDLPPVVPYGATQEAVDALTKDLPTAFVDEAGAEYVQIEGKYAERGGLPFDQTLFVDEATHKQIMENFEDGTMTYLNEENKLVAVGPDGIETPVEGEIRADPTANTSFSINVNQERKPTKDKIVHSIKPGRRVREVFLDRSMGAAGGAKVTQKETQFSQKLREAEGTIPKEMSDVGRKGIFYTPFTTTELDSASASRINRAETVEELKDVLETMRGENLALYNRTGTILYNKFYTDINTAVKNGDAAEITRLKKAFETLSPYMTATEAGQGLRFAAGKKDLDGLLAATTRIDEAYDAALSQIAIEEDVDATEVAAAPKALEEANARIEQLTKRVAELESSEYVTPEERVTQTLIKDIEQTASESKAEIDAEIEAEEADLQKDIERETRQAEKQKAKDEAVIEQEIGTLSTQLAETLAATVDLSAATKEEAAALNETVTKALKEAEAKTNAELTAAVQAERKALDAEDTRVQEAEARVEKLQTVVAAKQAKATKKLAELEANARAAESRGEDATDIRNQQRRVEAAYVKDLERLEKAKQNLQDTVAEVQGETESRQEAERILDALSEGVEVQTVPTPKGRKLAIKTKRTGLDVSKLFANKKSTAYGPLSVLANATNNLANVLSQTGKAKKDAGGTISKLTEKINGLRKTLDTSRNTPAVDRANKRKIEAAKKRLEKLNELRQQNTLDNNLSKPTKTKLGKLKARLDALKKTKPTKDPAIAEAEEELKKLEKARLKAERLAARKTEADKVRKEESRKAAEVTDEINKLEELLKDPLLSPSQQNALEVKLSALKASRAGTAAQYIEAYQSFIVNIIGGIYPTVLGITSSAIEPLAITMQYLPTTMGALLKKLNPLREQGYSLPLIEYFAGLPSWSNLKLGAEIARGALLEGVRVRSPYKRKELGPAQLINPMKVEDDRNLIPEDYLKQIWAAPIQGQPFLTQVKNIWFKTTGTLPGVLMRVLSAVEAIMATTHFGGFERLSASILYNKSSITEAEYQAYKTNRAERIAKATAEVDMTARAMAASGVPMSRGVRAAAIAEKYMQSGPVRDVNLAAYKLANRVGLNIPAQGFIGMATHSLTTGVNNLSQMHPVGVPAKWMTALANSIGVTIGRFLEFTPLGAAATSAVSSVKPDITNRTYVELVGIKGGAVMSLLTMGSVLAYALKAHDEEDEPWFDIIGMYTKKSGAEGRQIRSAAIQAGVVLNSIKLGNVYIPFPETTFAGLFGAMAEVLDRKRDGEELNFDSVSDAMLVMLTANFSALRPLESLPMMKGVRDIYEGLGDGLNGRGWVNFTRAVTNPIKSTYIPTSITRTVARYTDDPVEYKKDLTSAIVEGIPVMQSMYGMPALNKFGEVMTNERNRDFSVMHRMFSTKADDIDIRWLVDNGYDVPDIQDMQLTKDIREAYEKKQGEKVAKLDYEHKHAVYRMAAPQLRELVGRYRQTFGSHAKLESTQRTLTKEWNQIIAHNAARYLLAKQLL